MASPLLVVAVVVAVVAATPHVAGVDALHTVLSRRGAVITHNVAQHARLENAALDFPPREPLAVVYAVEEGDVVATVAAAAADGAHVAVRSGGNSGSGESTCCGRCVVLDVSQMAGVAVGRRLVVGPGVSVQQLADSLRDNTTHTVPLGVCGGVRMGGFVGGGGVGMASAKYGLAVDALQGARVVLANASVVDVSAGSHPDLWWALRGGLAAGLGVVVQYRFSPVPISPKATRVMAGTLAWPASVAGDVAAGYHRVVWSSGGRTAGMFLTFMDGQVAVHGMWMAPSKAAIKRLLSVPGAQGGFVPTTHNAAAATLVAPPPATRQWSLARSGLLRKSTCEDAEQFQGLVSAVSHATGSPPEGGSVVAWVEPWGGAIADVPSTGTAFPWRRVCGAVTVSVHFEAGPEWSIEEVQSWLDAGWSGVVPFLKPVAGGQYARYGNLREHDDEDKDVTTVVFGGNSARLLKVKAELDPDGMFLP